MRSVAITGKKAIGKKGHVPRIGNGVDMVNLLVYGKGAES